MKKNRVARFFYGQFFKSFTILLSGSVVAQILSMLFSAITMRIYTPQDMGVYTLLLSGANMFSGILCLRLDGVIVNANDKEYPVLIRVCFIMTVINSFIYSLIYSIYMYYTSQINIFLTFISVACILLFTGIFNILNSIKNRNKKFSSMSKITIFSVMITNTFQILFGLLKFKTYGIIIGQVLGLVYSDKYLSKQDVNIKSFRVKVSDFIFILKRYYKQIIFSTPSIFINSFSYTLFNLSIGKYFGNSVLGLYSISYRILAIPLNLISTNLSSVFYVEAKEEQRKTKKFKKSFYKSLIILLPIAIIMYICLNAFATPFITFYYGDKWGDAGKYVEILSLLFSIKLIANVFSPSLVISNKQQIDVCYQVSLVGIVFIINILHIIYNLSPLQYMFLVGNLWACVSFVSIIVTWLLSRKKL